MSLSRASTSKIPPHGFDLGEDFPQVVYHCGFDHYFLRKGLLALLCGRVLRSVSEGLAGSMRLTVAVDVHAAFLILFTAAAGTGIIAAHLGGRGFRRSNG